MLTTWKVKISKLLPIPMTGIKQGLGRVQILSVFLDLFTRASYYFCKWTSGNILRPIYT